MADLRTEIRRLVGSTGEVVRAAIALRHATEDQVLERLRELGDAVDAFEAGEPAPPRRAPRPQARKRAARARSRTPGGSADAVSGDGAEVSGRLTSSAQPPGDSTDEPVLQELEPEPEPSSVRAAPSPIPGETETLEAQRKRFPPPGRVPRHELIKQKLREAMERRSARG